MELEAAKVAARKAIYADGRGMIGAERNYLEYRVARAILSESARANAAEAELATLRADNERLGRERDEARIDVLSHEMDAQQVRLERYEAEQEIASLKKALAFADEQSTKVEALLDPHIAWDGKPTAAEAERDALLAQVEKMRGVLTEIAESDDIDNALDPERNKRLARAALTKEPS